LRNVKLGNRAGLVLDPKGLVVMLGILDEQGDRTDANRKARQAFLDWARTTLMPELLKSPDMPKAPVGPARIVVDFRKGHVLVERMDGTTSTVNF